MPEQIRGRNEITCEPDKNVLRCALPPLDLELASGRKLLCDMIPHLCGTRETVNQEHMLGGRWVTPRYGRQ